MTTSSPLRRFAARLCLPPLAVIAVLNLTRPALADGYQQTNLVSDGFVPAAVIDTDLVNPWGISFSPTGAFWVSDNGRGLSTLYNGAGIKQGLIVTIPPPAGSPAGTMSAPTGQIFNGTADFGGAAFLFATEDGTLSAWSGGTAAVLKADRSTVTYAPGVTGAVYKGLASAHLFFGNYLYATNFRSAAIDVFDSKFTYVGSFTDRSVPAGYAPFGIQNVGGDLVVTFAQQNAAKHDDVAGPGHGFVDVFSPYGFLRGRFASHGPLNSPWGIALAPAGFGRFSHALLIGNFGDGRINAYSVRSGRFLGALTDARHAPITIDGLWGLSFGNGGAAGKTNVLYFTAGLNHEADGLFGSLSALPGGDGEEDE